MCAKSVFSFFPCACVVVVLHNVDGACCVEVGHGDNYLGDGDDDANAFSSTHIYIFAHVCTPKGPRNTVFKPEFG